MKGTGFPWIGEIPAHWEVKKLKFLAQVRGGVTKGRRLGEREVISLPYLRVANVQDGFVDLTDVATIEVGRDEVERFSLRNGDVLMNEGGDNDKLGRGCVWEAQIEPCLHQNHVFAVRTYPRFSPSWIALNTSAEHSRSFFLSRAKQSTNLASISSSSLKEVPILLPPTGEQRAIANFLDRKTAAIDALIAKKERLIELLAEKRAALIQRAVTQGLDPDVPMKDSGVPWIGEIPAHWEVKKLKFLAVVRGGATKGRTLDRESVVSLPYLRVANVQDGFVDLSDVATIEVLSSEVARFRLKVGDILMNEGGDNDKLGRGCVWEAEIDPCLHQNHVFAVRPGTHTNPYWIASCTSAEYLRFFFLRRAKQSTNLASISSSNLKEAPILVPPPKEMEAILDWLSMSVSSAQRMEVRLRESLALLREYRQSLITAAVTGQLDIGEDAA